MLLFTKGQNDKKQLVLGFGHIAAKVTSLPDGVHRESYLMFTMSSDKDKRQKFAFAFAQCKGTSVKNRRRHSNVGDSPLVGVGPRKTHVNRRNLRGEGGERPVDPPPFTEPPS